MMAVVQTEGHTWKPSSLVMQIKKGGGRAMGALKTWTKGMKCARIQGIKIVVEVIS